MALAFIGGEQTRASMPVAVAVAPTTTAIAQARPLRAPAHVETALPIAGWIVDTAGVPVAGVRVSVRGDTATATSESDGAFRLVAPVAPKRALLFDGSEVFPAEVAWPAGEPPRIMLARRTHVTAHVVEGGRAIAGAEVTISDGSGPALATVVTDANGLARFDDLMPGPYELWARQGDHVSRLARVTELDEKPLDLALEPAGTIRGKLAIEGPIPAGTVVQLSPIDLDHATRIATVDPQGRFVLDGVLRGKWRLDGAAAGYVGTTQNLETRGARDDVELALQRAGTASGIVVDRSGAPVANAAIVLRVQGPRVEEPRPIAPPSRLRWVHPLAGARQLPTGDFGRFGAPRGGLRPAECGLGHCGTDLHAKRGTIIHAAADGEIAAAFTELRGEAGRYVAIDHGEGIKSYYMHMDELRPGLELGQRVRAGDPLGTVGATGAATGPHLHFAISHEAGRSWYVDPEPILRHAVVLPAPRTLDRAAAPDALVAALRWRELSRSTPTARELVTDSQGRFRVDGVVPGSYVAVAYAPRLAPGTSPAFVVRTGGATDDITIALAPGTPVHGRVLGPNGPIAGARISAAAGAGESLHELAQTYSDATGEYTLHALAGRVTLSVSAMGFGGTERPIVLGDRISVREEFTLTVEDSQLRGQVLAPDGGAAGPVTIRVIDGPTRRRGASDPSGRFTLERVAAGRYTIEISSPDFPTRRTTLDTERFVEIRLEAGGSTRVTLRDAQAGSPLASTRVDARGPDGQTITRTTDANGVVELRGLAVGEWTLSARAPGYAASSTTVTVRPARVPQDARLELSRGATIAGVVRDRYGCRVPNARVSLGSLSTQADAEGNFRLADVPAGAQTLEADAPAGHTSQALQLSPGETRLSLSVELVE